MNRIEYLKKLDELKLDKNRYCINKILIIISVNLSKSAQN